MQTTAGDMTAAECVPAPSLYTHPGDLQSNHSEKRLIKHGEKE